MGKEKDYLDKIEEYRQEVELDDVSKNRTRTRRTRTQNNAPKSPLMKILVVIFIFIPLSILGYVWFFYEPEVETVTPETDNSIVKIEKNNNTYIKFKELYLDKETGLPRKLLIKDNNQKINTSIIYNDIKIK